MRNIRLKNQDQFQALRESGRRLASVMETVSIALRPGISTGKFDSIAEAKILELGGIPIFKGYGAEYGSPFPASICISLNDEVVHGVPQPNRIVRDGDLVKLDMGLRFDGMVTDMARTFLVGTGNDLTQSLLRITRESLDQGIAQIVSGKSLADYGGAVQKHVESHGFSIVRDLAGHGVGFELHEPPEILNYQTKLGRQILFEAGMAIALEPIVNAGHYSIELASDDTTYVTSDHSLSAHFEDTVLITTEGIEIVTRPS